MKPGWHKRKYDRREGRKSSRFIDRTGMIAHRLLYLEWLGRWGKSKAHWWRALCDCGTTVEVQWRPSDVRSCGCLNNEMRRTHGWETQRPDGRWGLKNQKRLVLADGTVTTAHRLAEQVGLAHSKMCWRIRHWPEHRWLEPVHATGRHKAVIRKTSWHRRPQPWASATMKKINAEGRNRPCSARPDSSSSSLSSSGRSAGSSPRLPSGSGETD